MPLRTPWRRPYLLVVTNLYCNHRCSYCIQQESSLDVRLNPKRVDVEKLLAFLRVNRIDRSIKVMGGEATLHPDWERLMDGLLGLYRRVVVTTNLNGKWYKDFDAALAKMTAWGSKVRWNTTYHPAWMEAELYVERVRALRGAGLDLEQVTATDTPELSDEAARFLHAAGIGWTLQPFTGRAPDGRLAPERMEDVRAGFPMLYDPTKFIERHAEYEAECEDANNPHGAWRDEWVECTSARFLVGPDGKVYPCHRHLYAEDEHYACGSIEDLEMRSFRPRWNDFRGRWTLDCATKCNPCDFGNVKIRPLGRAVERAPASGAAHA